MKKLARLAGLLSLAIFALGLMASSSASAIGYLLLPVGGTILGTGLAGILAGGGSEIACSSDTFTAEVATVHLVGPFVVKFAGCSSSSDKGVVKCTAKSTGAAEGEIATTTLHALIGLALPSNTPALLVLPVSGTKFVTVASNKCTITTTASGNVVGLLLQKVGGGTTTKANLDFVPGDPTKITLPLGGTVVSEIEAFGALATFETQQHLLYDTPGELMP